MGSGSRAVDVLAWPLTLGRALDNDVVIDDPYVAPHHARIDIDAAGELTLTVLTTVNGLELQGIHLQAGQSSVLRPTLLPTSTQPFTQTSTQTSMLTSLQLGQTRLQLRLPQDALAPEQPLPARALASAPSSLPASVPNAQASAKARSRAWPWLAGLALMVFEAASLWINLDPGADFSAWLPLMLGVPVALVVWCGVWALLSKLFNHDFDFSGHLKLALPWVLAIVVVQAWWPQIAATLAVPTLWRLTPLLLALMAALWVKAHLSHVLPHKQRAVSVGVAAMALGAVAITAASNLRSNDSLSSSAYMSTLPLPALRLGSIGDDKKLLEGLAPLAAQLAVRVKKARDDEEEGDDSAD